MLSSGRSRIFLRSVASNHEQEGMPAAPVGFGLLPDAHPLPGRGMSCPGAIIRTARTHESASLPYPSWVYR
jgi:hypothetical protein